MRGNRTGAPLGRRKEGPAINTWELLAAACALGLWIKWGNGRAIKGRKRPEDSRVFGVVLLAVFGVVMYAWLRATGQIG